MTSPPTCDTTAGFARVLRFDRVQRVTHWALAVLFTVLIATAVPLYFGSFFGFVLPRHPVQLVHLGAGLALPVPVLAALVGPWGARMRRDVRRFNYWTRDEVTWLRTLGHAPLAAEKFNPGQKLNAVFVGASIIVMLITGAMLQWFRYFSISEREGATFVHDGFAFLLVVVIVGHLYMALTHRESLRSMFDGAVSRRWVDQHAPAWRDDHDDLAPDAQHPAGP